MAEDTRPKAYRTCIKAGCDQLPGTAWSPYWCPEHDRERRERITKRLQTLAPKLDLPR